MKRCPRCQLLLPDVLDNCPRDGEKLPETEDIVPLHPEDEPIHGQLVAGKYILVTRLGLFGISRLFLARQKHSDRRLLVAMTPMSDATDLQDFSRLHRGGQAGYWGHDHLVEVVDFGQTEGWFYLGMDGVDVRAPRLANLLQEGPLSPIRALRLAAQICAGVAALHERNLVHGSLSPEAIFVLNRAGVEDWVKVLWLPGVTPAKSPEYLAPEGGLGGRCDHRGDQYSIGVLLYQMLTGALPFAADSTTSVLRRQLLTDAAPPSRKRQQTQDSQKGANKGVHLRHVSLKDVDALVLRTLHQNPTMRFPSVSDLESAITQAIRHLTA